MPGGFDERKCKKLISKRQPHKPDLSFPFVCLGFSPQAASPLSRLGLLQLDQRTKVLHFPAVRVNSAFHPRPQHASPGQWTHRLGGPCSGGSVVPLESVGVGGVCWRLFFFYAGFAEAGEGEGDLRTVYFGSFCCCKATQCG